MGLVQPDVALTDYVLALECGMSVWCLRGAGTQGRRFAVFFAATACAAALGGTVHGLYSGANTFVARLLWSATLLAIGVAALGAWAAGAALVLTPPRARWLVRAAALELIGYAVVVLSGATAFAVAIYQYFPAAVFLLVAFAIGWSRRRATPLLFGLAGAALTLIAAAVQHAEWALSPRYFTYNATYHSVQAIACARCLRTRTRHRRIHSLCEIASISVHTEGRTRAIQSPYPPL